MTLFKSLTLPLHMTGLMFIGFTSILFAICEHGGLYGIPAEFLLASWLFKYCFVMLEHAADGITEAPVATVEMLGPFEARPWIQAVMCAAVFGVIRYFGGVTGQVLSVVALLLLPVSIGVLGTSGHFYEAFNGLTLLRVLRGLGAHYFYILGFIALMLGIDSLLLDAPLWEVARLALIELSVLMVFCFIGGAIHARRVELGFEPRSSPERVAAAAERDYEVRRQKLLDEVFTLVRARQYRAVTQPLATWLAAADPARLAPDATAMIATAQQWPEKRGGETVADCVIGWLVDNNRLGVALQMLELVLKTDPGFVLPSGAHAQRLAVFAASNGRPRLAQALRASGDVSAAASAAVSAAPGAAHTDSPAGTTE